METIEVIYRASDNGSCFLTGEQNELYCGNTKDENIILIFGSLHIHVRKVMEERDEKSASVLYLSENLKSQIFIPDHSILQIKKLQDGHIELGPLIGVFINIKKMGSLSIGKTDNVYEEISKAIKKLNGICCFFSMGDIDWEKRLVKGIMRMDTGWVPHILPLPRVIYDRCFGIYGRDHGMEFRSKLGSGYKVVNAMPKLAKWETICALRKDPSVKDLIPETILYKSFKDIETALTASASIYLKPDALYKGKGIFRVSRLINGTYKIEHRSDTKNEVQFLPDLQEIDKLIAHYSVLGGGYLVQQEVEKATYRGYPFDFRLLYQKDWQGIWQPTGIAVRMGAIGSIITSPRSGGAVARFEAVLKEEFNEDVTTQNGLYEKILTAGRQVVETLEREFGDCVELGLDMTIDKSGHIWVIEVNGKPLKVSLKWLNDAALMSRCYARPIEYTVFLTGFQSASTDVQGGLG